MNILLLLESALANTSHRESPSVPSATRIFETRRSSFAAMSSATSACKTSSVTVRASVRHAAKRLVRMIPCRSCWHDLLSSSDRTITISALEHSLLDSLVGIGSAHVANRPGHWVPRRILSRCKRRYLFVEETMDSSATLHAQQEDQIVPDSHSSIK